MTPLDNFLVNIKENSAFPELKLLLEQQRPRLPEFDPERDNVDEWKQKSGMKKGYDLALALFKIQLGVNDG